LNGTNLDGFLYRQNYFDAFLKFGCLPVNRYGQGFQPNYIWLYKKYNLYGFTESLTGPELQACFIEIQASKGFKNVEQINKGKGTQEHMNKEYHM
jgi:hypothetical protein